MTGFARDDLAGILARSRIANSKFAQGLVADVIKLRNRCERLMSERDQARKECVWLRKRCRGDRRCYAIYRRKAA